MKCLKIMTLILALIKNIKRKFKNRKTLIKNNTIYRHEKLQ